MADNLSSLFQYAPTTAGAFVGQQQADTLQNSAQERARLAQLIAASQGSERREELKLPGELENKSLTNQGLQLGLPGITADSKKKAIDAKLAEATFDSDVKTKKAAADKAAGEEEVAQVERAQTMLLRMGAQLDGVPPPLRGKAFASMLEQSGMKANAPHLKALMAVDPQNMPAAATALANKLGQQLLTMNPAAQASMYGAREAAAAHRYSADQSASASRYGADARSASAAAKLKSSETNVKTIWAQAQSGKFNLDKLLATAALGEQMAETPEERIRYTELAGKLEQLKMNLAVAGKTGSTQLNAETGELGARPAPRSVWGADSNANGKTKSGNSYKIEETK